MESIGVILPQDVCFPSSHIDYLCHQSERHHVFDDDHDDHDEDGRDNYDEDHDDDCADI